MTDTNPRPIRSEIAVTEANDNETVALRLGDALTIRLQESPSSDREVFSNNVWEGFGYLQRSTEAVDSGGVPRRRARTA
jgi:hypothetical protein